MGPRTIQPPDLPLAAVEVRRSLIMVSARMAAWVSSELSRPVDEATGKRARTPTMEMAKMPRAMTTSVKLKAASREGRAVEGGRWKDS